VVHALLLGNRGWPAAAEAEFTSPSETFFDGNLLGVEALSAESMAVAAAGDGAERVGGGVQPSPVKRTERKIQFRSGSTDNSEPA